MRWYLIPALMTPLFAANLPAQQPAQDTSSTIVTEPVFQTNGPYKVVEEMEASLPNHTVYRPKNLAGLKEKLPVLAWGNGGCFNAGNSFETYLTEIASFGYIVVANGPIVPMLVPDGRPARPGVEVKRPTPEQMAAASRQQTTTRQLLDSLDWVAAQNSDAKSPYFGKIATDAIAVAGQSCGGLEALEAATDPRVKTAMIVNSGIIRDRSHLPNLPGNAKPDGTQAQLTLPGTPETLKKLHTPVIYIIGGEKDIAYKNAEQDFQEIQSIPLFNANLNGVGHGGTLAQPFGGRFAQTAVHWLQWQLKGDNSASTAFLGPDCTLCKDPDWVVKKKNIR